MKKTILLGICMAMLLCFGGCQKEKKLGGTEFQQLMEKLAANNPYREKDSIIQANFDPMTPAICMNEIVSVWNQDSYVFVIKEIYTTDKNNVYRFVIVYEGSDYDLYVTLNKDDATELVMELPATKYKETYVLDRGLDLDGLLEKLDGKAYSGAEIALNFDRAKHQMNIWNFSDSEPSVFKIAGLDYIGIDNYSLHGTLYSPDGGISDCTYSIKMTSYPDTINVKSDNPLFPVAMDFHLNES